MSKQSNFLSGLTFDRKDQRVRKSLLVRITLLASISFLAPCFFLVESSEITICLLGFATCLLLAGTAHFFNALDVSAHSFIVLSFFSLAVLISRTGGINSPVIVWMPTISIAALLLLNLKWSVAWLGIIIFHHFGQFIAVQYLLINADVGAATITPITTLWTKWSLAVALMLALFWYEVKYRNKNARFAARTRALGELQASLQQTRDQIDALVSALENQLRAPMQRIRLMDPITQLEVPTASVTKDDANAVAQASDQLLNLVDELGDIAKLAAGQLVLDQSPFDVHKALANVTAALKARSAGCDVVIQWATDHPTRLWAMGDGARLSRVLVDLLAQSMDAKIGATMQVNATFKGRLLAIEIPQAQAIQTNSENPRSALENSDVAQTKKTTDAAYLQKQRLRDELVAMAGGRIVHVRSADGMVLRLEWPILAVAEPDCANQASKSDWRQTLRVMLIGSQTTQQFEMQQTLRQMFETCEFGVADNAHTALVQLDFGNFDLVLIELKSPNLDALELTRSIRRHAKPHVRALTVIGLGNAMLAPQRQHYLDAGMQWVLFRPWTTDTLFRALSAQLR